MHNMKKTFHVLKIPSRKINKWVTKKTLQEEPELMANAMLFVHELNEEQVQKKLPDKAYWNSDQSRFEHEVKRDRK